MADSVGRKAKPKRARRKRAVCEPSVIAGIDVGATSVRMKISQLSSQGELSTLDELVHPVALGTDTFRVGYVTPETLRALSQVLKNFSKILAEYDVKHCHAVATSAIREATNQDILIDRIRHESGMSLEVLDGVAETRMTYQMLLPFLREHVTKRNRHTLILDLGGGSTEFMVLKGKDLVFAGSRRLGASRLFHRIVCSECGDAHTLLESVVSNVVRSTLDLCRAYRIHECVVINPILAEALSRADDAQKLEHGLVLPVDAARKTAEVAENLTPEALAGKYSMTQARAELFLPLAMILNRFLDNIPVKRVFLAEADLLGAILQELSSKICGRDPIEEFHSQILGSAVGVAKKFHYDKEHSTQVAKLSNQLYDGLAGFLDLDGKDRLYLEVAAILHDIGMFISERAHHKHSAYLIQWAEIVGLSEDERALVAHIARYHRKASPGPNHAEFWNLSSQKRLKTTKISSLLRIADALDRGHANNITKVVPQIRDDELALMLESDRDPAVEILALREKANLFEEITGLKVRAYKCQK